ncbi:MAG: hypothetical protein ACM36A_02730 [Bacteroidota bacterium]
MTRAQLTVGLLPSVLLIVLGLSLLALAWNNSHAIAERNSKFTAVEQTARAIDAKAGIPDESPASAVAMARALNASDKAESGYVQIIQSFGVLVLILAVFQAGILWRLYRKGEPSNNTLERDARKSGARPSA